MLGSDDNGDFNLQITNVTLEDDADYECQVGPASYNRPIRHRAHLHVLREYITDAISIVVWKCTEKSQTSQVFAKAFIPISRHLNVFHNLLGIKNQPAASREYGRRKKMHCGIFRPFHRLR